MPTILNVAGLPVPSGLAGISLLERPQSERVLFAEQGQQIAVRTNQFKFIYHLDDSRTELYALQNDPGERNNLAGDDEELALTFRDRLFQWLEETEQSGAAPREEVAADAMMLERLRGLGYLK